MMIPTMNGGEINTKYIVRTVAGKVDLGWTDMAHFRPNEKMQPYLNNPLIGMNYGGNDAKVVVMEDKSIHLFVIGTNEWNVLQKFLESEKDMYA